MTETWPPYAKWQARLRGENPPMHESEPEEGFWRGKLKDGKEFVGIAIWPDSQGGFYATRDKSAVRVDWVWPWCGRNPVTEEAFRTWETEGAWPDDHRIEAPASNHNEPADEAEILQDQIESARAGAHDYDKVESDEQAAKAQSLRSRLLELSREADRKREAEKKPHFDAAKAADGRWMPMVKAAKEIADNLAKAMGVWETSKARAAAEAQRKIDEEARRSAEEARAAVEAGKPVPEPRTSPEVSNVPPPSTQVRGAYGRAASVRVVKVAQVVDQDTAYQFHKADPEVVSLIAKLSQRAIDRGFEVPGVEVEEARRVA